ncbi:MAG: flagellar export chaperone FliS, partial [Defluviitoga tunisiensis]
MNNFQNSNVYFENSVKTASPTKLVELLYKNSIERIDKAIKAIDNNNLIEANNEIIRVEDIILELNVSLNIEKGGEVAKNLRLLYNYIYEQLV